MQYAEGLLEERRLEKRNRDLFRKPVGADENGPNLVEALRVLLEVKGVAFEFAEWNCSCRVNAELHARLFFGPAITVVLPGYAEVLPIYFCYVVGTLND